jgi:uncharacterized membrane protein
MSQSPINPEHLLDERFTMDKMVAITINEGTLTEKGSSEEQATANISSSDDINSNQHVVGFRYSDTRESHSPKRMIFYADSVMAITKLFLIIPLMKAVHEAEAAGMSLLEFLEKHISLLPSFALSFSIISVFWGTHEELFRHVKSVSTNMVEVFNNLFLFGVTTMPVTAATSHYFFPPFVYVINLILINLFLTAMHIVVRRDLQIQDPDHVPCTSFGLLHISFSFIILIIILMIVCIFPNQHLLYLLFTLLFVKPMMRLYHGIDKLTGTFGNILDQILECRSKRSS